MSILKDTNEMAFSGFTSLCVCLGLVLSTGFSSVHASEPVVNAVITGKCEHDCDVRVVMGLSMIVKNEAHVIERALHSIKPYLDYYVIVDTGSTDNTMEIIQRVMADVPGQVVSRPWVNFAHNRNEALDLLRPHATHAFFLDADDQVELSCLKADASLSPPYWWKARGLALADRAAMVPIRYGALQYHRMAIVATASVYRWSGVVHEVIHDPTGTEPIEHPTIQGMAIKVVGGGARSKDPLKYQKDALALQEYLQQVPNDTRTVFYIAQSYRDAGDTAKAIEWYEKRVALNGWKEEVFWSLYQLAVLHNTDDAFARAARYASWRLEPIYHRARLARERGDYAMAFAMAVYGQAFLTDYTKLPPDTLFLDQDIYKYGMLFERSVAAFWVRQLTEFKNNMRWLQGLGETLPEPWRSHVKFNAQWLPPGEPAESLSVGPDSLLGIPPSHPSVVGTSTPSP